MAGATRNRVVVLILKEDVIPACAGLVLGLVAAYFAGRTMRSTLYGVGAIDVSAFAIVVAVLLIAALLACYLPERCCSVEPMQLLRME